MDSEDFLFYDGRPSKYDWTGPFWVVYFIFLSALIATHM